MFLFLKTLAYVGALLILTAVFMEVTKRYSETTYAICLMLGFGLCAPSLLSAGFGVDIGHELSTDDKILALILGFGCIFMVLTCIHELCVNHKKI